MADTENPHSIAKKVILEKIAEEVAAGSHPDRILTLAQAYRNVVGAPAPR
ncbi:hypothetical protein [Microlunatus sp. Y2014]